MPPGQHETTTMRTLDDWFARCAMDFQSPRMRAVHALGIIVTAWAVIAALWTIPPIAPQWFRPGLWAVLAMLAAYGFYRRLARNLAYAMAIAFILGGALAWASYAALGPRPSLVLAVALFALGTAARALAHVRAGHRVPFPMGVMPLVIDPAWLMAQLLRRLGIAY